ncbi:MAG: hypothetical protein OHK0052_23380 [Anaerolineales bacterium]
MKIHTSFAHRAQRFFGVGFIFALNAALLMILFIGAKAQTAEVQAFEDAPPPAIEASALQIGVRASKQGVRPGETFAYTLGVAVDNVRITDTLSGGQIWDFGYQSSPAIPTQQFTYTVNPAGGYWMQWQLGQIPANSSGSIVLYSTPITTTEPNPNKPVILLGNAAEIGAPGSGVSGGEDSDVVTVVGPLLDVRKAVSSKTILPGHVLAYTLTVSNLSRSDSIAATNIERQNQRQCDGSIYAGKNCGNQTEIWQYAFGIPR